MLNHPFARRPAGILLIVFALALAGTAFVSWQADSAAEAGNWPRAIAWRPGVALYHLRLGEQNIAYDSPLAGREFVRSLQLDPYNPVAAADLATVEISLRRHPQASRLTQRMASTTSFDERWREANLRLMKHDLPGFWAEMQRACAIADRDDVFASVVSRALTVSDYDFSRLYATLPRGNDHAAEAFLDAAVEYRQLKSGQEKPVAPEILGFRWLRHLPATADAYVRREREAAAEKYLRDLLLHSPEAVPDVWRAGRAAGLFHGVPLPENGELITDGSFPHPIPTEEFPPPQAGGLTRIFAWLRDDSGRVLVNTVTTGDPHYPTAVALTFDGDENDQVKLAHRWFVARPGTTLTLSAIARSLRAQPSGGVLLILRDRYGSERGRLALAAPAAWQRSQTSLVLPSLPSVPPRRPDGSQPGRLTPAPLEAYRLSLEYQRPLGALPLNNVVAVTSVSLHTAAGGQ